VDQGDGEWCHNFGFKFTLLISWPLSVILGVDVAQQKWINLTSVEAADRQNEIVQMCWNDNEQKEVSICSG